MNISLNRSLTRRSQPNWRDFVSVAARVGYEAVDMSVDEALADGPEAAAQLLSAHGLRVGGVPMPVECTKEERVFEDQFGQLKQAAAFTAAAGGSGMCTWLPASSEVPRETLEPLLRRRLGMCAAVLRDHGLALGLEFLGPLHMRMYGKHQFIWQMRDAAAFAQDCGPNVGLVLDSWHWHLSGATASDIVEMGDMIVHVQVADAPDLPPEKIWDQERLFPGEGIVDLAGFFGSLLQCGYTGAVSPEIFGRGLDQLDTEVSARLGFESTKAALAAAVYDGWEHR